MMSEEVMRNGVLRWESKPEPEPIKPEPVGDPRRREYCIGIMIPDRMVDYGDERKTMVEWCELVADRITPKSRQTLPDGLYTETEFFDNLETLGLEMYC